MAKNNDRQHHTDITNEFDIDSMVNEFRSVKNISDSTVTADDLFDDIAVTQILSDTASATPTDTETSVIPDDEALSKKTEQKTDGTPATPVHSGKQKKRNAFMRFLAIFLPRMGDSVLDIVIKVVMIVGIIVFIGAGTCLLDYMVIVPIHNQIEIQSLDAMYNPGETPQLTPEEQNYTYPEDMDPAFKKLYYRNNDVRAWISFQSLDNTTLDVEYPVVQSSDNEYYLNHDFNKTYNTNGSLYFDHRNDFSSPTATNKNLIIYGHNMASGQMFGNLDLIAKHINFARVCPSFTVNTLYSSIQYKVFAVIIVNNNPADGPVFNYLRTDFDSDIDYADFLANILARSLYVYGDVDVRPDDDIITLSTCTSYGDVPFHDGRAVVIARKLREGEDISTNTALITQNVDVIMPYAWYTNKEYTPHPYYTDHTYTIPILPTLAQYLAEQRQESTTTPPTTPTTPSDPGSTTDPTVPTQPVMTHITVESTPSSYSYGSAFNKAATSVIGVYSDGTTVPINIHHCGIEGFSPTRVGECVVTIHYGALNTSVIVTVGPPPTVE